MQDHSTSLAVSLPSSSEGFSIHGDNAPENFGGEREEVHDGMQDDFEMEGSGDDDEDGGDDTKDVGVLPHRRGRGRPPRSRKFNHRWRATRPWLMHIAPRDGVHGYMKCAACQAANVNTRWGDCPGIGCSSFQLSSVKEHEGSALHAHAMLRWAPMANNPEALRLARVVANAIDAESARILACMKILYHLVVLDRAINQYEDTCDLVKHLRAPDMPTSDEYGSYTSRQSAYDFLWAISQYLRDVNLQEVKDSPILSLLVDESTDRTLEQHLIVYVCYLARGGMGPPCMQFVELLSVPRGTREVMYNKIVELMREFEWPLEKVVGLATDGAASMTGVRSGLATRLSVDVPTLITTHCIAHR